MKVYAGTSGYSYKEWKGSFYPEKTKPADMLGYYASQLPAVEINNTFYRLPRASVVESWADQVPEGFRFWIKASRKITHFKRLAGVEEETAYLLETARLLGERLGGILFQLPPNLKCDLERFRTFLATLPGAPLRAAFEFRHDSWSDPAVAEALSEHGAAMVIAETDDAYDPELITTASHGYLRLRRTDYQEADLERWRARLDDTGWDEAYVFFKHEDEASGPRLAARFLEIGDS